MSLVTILILALVIAIPIFLFLFIRWAFGRNLTKGEKNKRSMKFVRLVGYWFLIIGLTNLYVSKFSFDGDGWKGYFFLLMGSMTLYVTRKKNPTGFDELPEADKVELKKFWKQPLSVAVFLLMAVGWFVFFKMMEQTDNPAILLIPVATMLPFYFRSKLYLKKMNSILNTRGLPPI